VLGQAEINMNSAHSTANGVASASVQRPALKDDFLDKHLVTIVAPSTILIDLNEKGQPIDRKYCTWSTK